MTVCNPMTANNPFESWQKLWMQGLNVLQPQAPVKQDLPSTADMFGSFNAMQNIWLQGLNAFAPQTTQQPPAATNPFMPLSAMPFSALPFGQMPDAVPQMPKITVTTIELGDMRPYMEMASTMMQTFAPMLSQWGRK